MEPKRIFKVAACWDDEAKVWYSDSDIKGLNIETDTIEQFEEILLDVAVELILTNHFRPQDLINRPMSELVPAILWQRPEPQTASA